MSLDVFRLVPRFMASMVTICLLSAAGAFLARGGVSLHLWGLAVTDLAGRSISRPRALWRALVAGSPLLVAGGVVHGTSLSEAQDAFVAVAGVALWIAGSMYALAAPERGVQDRIARTSLVPQ